MVCRNSACETESSQRSTSVDVFLKQLQDQFGAFIQKVTRRPACTFDVFRVKLRSDHVFIEQFSLSDVHTVRVCDCGSTPKTHAVFHSNAIAENRVHVQQTGVRPVVLMVHIGNREGILVAAESCRAGRGAKNSFRTIQGKQVRK